MAGQILCVDKYGNAVEWISAQKSVAYYALGEVLWEMGPKVACFRSGVSRITGEQTIIEPSAIISVNGVASPKLGERMRTMAGRNRRLLFARDRHMCAYCGGVFAESNLSKDHIVPWSKGGTDRWMNVVTACLGCNQKKADRSLQEANMQLLYAPYVPSRYEGLILRNRNILADQMEFLLAKVPKSSRLWQEYHKGH